MKSNAQRQHDWRTQHVTGFGRVKASLTMRRLFDYVLEHGDTNASNLYRAMNAHRDKKSWVWLTSRIQQNALLESDAEAPLTQIGNGTNTNPIIYRLSENWDTARDWDAEQQEQQ